MRKGMAMLVQQTLGDSPFSGSVYVFRGRRGGSIKVLWHVMHRHTTHNKCYADFKDFSRAVLSFLREKVPRNWHVYCDQVTDNFRIIAMALGCVCSSNAWNAGNSSGRCRRLELYRSHQVSFPRCSKDASGELVGPRRYGGIRAAITRDGGGTPGGHLPDRPVRPGAADRLGGVFLALYPDSAGSRTNRLPNRLSGILLTE